MSELAFRPLTLADAALVHGWLARPHVAAWWGEAGDLATFTATYVTPASQAGTLPLDAVAGMVPYLLLEAGAPIGYAQAYRVMASQADGWWPDETDPHALGIDQFLADEGRLGQGLGTRVLRAFTAMLFTDPRVTTIQTDPDPTNGRAVACYRKVGFQDVGVVETPDGPAWLMRLGRVHPVPRPVGGRWTTCDFCGHAMLDLHCKLRCERCGFVRDCSDP